MRSFLLMMMLLLGTSLAQLVYRDYSSQIGGGFYRPPRGQYGLISDGRRPGGLYESTAQEGLISGVDYLVLIVEAV